MNGRSLALVVLLSLLVGCDASPPSARGARDRDMRSSAGDDTLVEASFALRGDQLIARLSPGQARQMCRDAARRVDLCHVAGRAFTSPDGCAAAVETCHAQTPGPTTDCSDARFDFPAPCSATVTEYLDCVDAWGRQQATCRVERLGPDPTPVACLPLLQHCPYLESEFGPASSIVLPCASASPPRIDESDDIVGLDHGRPLRSRWETASPPVSCLPPCRRAPPR
jgi:hypothetical protein